MSAVYCCPQCRGTGRVWTSCLFCVHREKIPCPVCHGLGYATGESCTVPLDPWRHAYINPGLESAPRDDAGGSR